MGKVEADVVVGVEWCPILKGVEVGSGDSKVVFSVCEGGCKGEQVRFCPVDVFHN